jgi:hypothetical protein
VDVDVGVAVGVAVNVDVAVGVNVAVGGSGVAVNVDVAVGIAVGVAVNVNVAVGVAVGVAVNVNVGVAVGGSGVTVNVDVAVGVGVAVGVAVSVADGVAVTGPGVRVGRSASAVTVGEALSAGRPTDIGVAVWPVGGRTGAVSGGVRRACAVPVIWTAIVCRAMTAEVAVRWAELTSSAAATGWSASTGGIVSCVSGVNEVVGSSTAPARVDSFDSVMMTPKVRANAITATATTATISSFPRSRRITQTPQQVRAAADS